MRLARTSAWPSNYVAQATYAESLADRCIPILHDADEGLSRYNTATEGPIVTSSRIAIPANAKSFDKWAWRFMLTQENTEPGGTTRSVTVKFKIDGVEYLSAVTDLIGASVATVRYMDLNCVLDVLGPGDASTPCLLQMVWRYFPVATFSTAPIAPTATQQRTVNLNVDFTATTDVDIDTTNSGTAHNNVGNACVLWEQWHTISPSTA